MKIIRFSLVIPVIFILSSCGVILYSENPNIKLGEHSASIKIDDEIFNNRKVGDKKFVLYSSNPICNGVGEADNNVVYLGYVYSDYNKPRGEKQALIPTDHAIIASVEYGSTHLFHSENCSIAIEFQPEKNGKYILVTKRERKGNIFRGAGKCYANVMQVMTDEKGSEYLKEPDPIRWGSAYAFQKQKLYCDENGKIYYRDEWEKRNKSKNDVK